MNIIHKIASRGLKADKLKNILAAFTILFAVCLMMSIGLYFLGDANRKENEISSRYQASFLNMSNEKIQKLRAETDVEQVGVSKELGSIDGEDHKLSLIYMDESQLKLNHFDNLNGRLPKKNNEIVILEDYVKFLGEQIHINDVITLGYGVQAADFVVSGILPVESGEKNFLVIVSDAYAKETAKNDLTYSAYVKMKNTQNLTSDEIREKIKVIGDKIGCDKKNIIFSSYYFALKDMDASAQWGIMVGVYAVIIVACALVIYSIFYVSVISKLHEYGRLRTIGANRKQIKAIIQREANQLAVMGIPAGILISAILSYCSMPDVFQVKRVLLMAVIVSGIVYMMIKAATARPGKMAAAVSPIMAIKAGYFETTRKKRTKKMHRRLSPYHLAYISVMRNKKKAILTVCSLGFCGILLMASASYLESIDPVAMAKTSIYPYGEMKIRYLNEANSYKTDEMKQLQDKDYFNQKFLDKISAIEGVEGIKLYNGAMSDFELKNGMIESATVDLLSEQDFEQIRPYILEGDITYEQLADQKGIMAVDIGWETIYGFGWELGDTIKVTNAGGAEDTYKIMGIISADYFGGGENIYYTTSRQQKFLSDYAGNPIYQIEVKADPQKLPKVEETIRELIKNTAELEIITLEEDAASFKASLDGQIAPIFMLVLFIAIFGIVNMTNTLLTNVITRKKELSVMQTIGLSNKQLRIMLICEGFVYFIGISIMTISVGSIAGIILCNGMDKISAFGKVSYHFPGYQAAIYLTAIMIITVCCSIAATVYYQRETLVERMRSRD